MTAVHFGAGNIGRGFIGLLLHQAGHHVTFVDVAAPLIDLIDRESSFRVIETGSGARVHTVSNFSALNSADKPEAVIEAISSADIVTTAVGPTVLRFVAPLIAEALGRRRADRPLVVMACENAINATDILRSEIAKHADPADLDRAVFANTAVDRIVPGQPDGAGLDVVVESFCEWVIDRSGLGEFAPDIPGAHFVDNLAPYIERKLLTVNTGHASTAYLGKQQGASFIAEALEIDAVREHVSDVLRETSAMLVRRHGLDESEQSDYAAKTLARFANPELADLIDRVGRQPLRKLSRHERLIEPAAALAEHGDTPTALLGVVTAALLFDVPDDPESVELQSARASLEPADIARSIMGVHDDHPLFESLVDAIRSAR